MLRPVPIVPIVQPLCSAQKRGQRTPRLPRTYPKLPCSPPIECETALQRGYSGSTHEEIVISRAFTKAVFPGTIEGAGSSRSKPHGSSKFKGSTFNDHTPSDSSSVSGILETSK